MIPPICGGCGEPMVKVFIDDWGCVTIQCPNPTFIQKKMNTEGGLMAVIDEPPRPLKGNGGE